MSIETRLWMAASTVLLAVVFAVDVEAAPCAGNLHLVGNVQHADPGCLDESFTINIQRDLCCGAGCAGAPEPPQSMGPPTSCTESPMRRARVELWIDGVLSFVTLTDSNGSFDFCLNNSNPSSGATFQAYVLSCPDGAVNSDACGSLAGTPQPWSVTVTDSSGVFYIDGTQPEPGVCTGAIRWDVFDRRSTEAASKTIYDLCANDAFDMLVTETGWTNTHQLPMRFPDAGTGFSTTQQTLSIASGDEQDPDRILRAYSFFVLHQLYGQSFPSVSGSCAASTWGVETDLSCAWLNGAARFLQAAIQNDPWYEDTSVPGGPPVAEFNLENATPPVGGPIDEGAVAAALWDFFDPIGETADSLALGLQPVFSIIENHQPENICEFADAYREENGPTPELDQILVSHRIGCPRLFGLIIGNQEGLLLRADKDAQNVFDRLSTFPNWAPVAAGNTSGPEGTLATWMTRLDAMEVRPGDALVFFYSGHAGTVDNSNQESSTGDETPVDVEAGLIDEPNNSGDEAIQTSDGFGLRDDELADYFKSRESKWGEVLKVFILDACYSGGFVGDGLTSDTGDLETLTNNYILVPAASEGDPTPTVTLLLDGFQHNGTTFELGTGVWTNFLLPLLTPDRSFVQLQSEMNAFSSVVQAWLGDPIGIKVLTETGDEAPFDPAWWGAPFTIAPNLDPMDPLLRGEPVKLPEPSTLISLVTGSGMLAVLHARRRRGRWRTHVPGAQIRRSPERCARLDS